jgi:nucleoside-diphosphate-sugar epimerase
LEIVKTDSSLIEAPLPADDPKQRKPDISLARSVLGWEPSIHLEEGLRQTIDYFRQKV